MIKHGASVYGDFGRLPLRSLSQHPRAEEGTYPDQGVGLHGGISQHAHLKHDLLSHEHRRLRRSMAAHAPRKTQAQPYRHTPTDSSQVFTSHWYFVYTMSWGGWWLVAAVTYSRLCPCGSKCLSPADLRVPAPLPCGPPSPCFPPGRARGPLANDLYQGALPPGPPY